MAQRVGLRHDEARLCYALDANTVANFDAFSDTIGDYYSYHFSACVANGGALSRTEAAGHAKEILERQYRRRSATPAASAMNASNCSAVPP